MFTDRADAGEQLADELVTRGTEADLVLGIPRGGLPVARPVAERLGAPLDIVVAKKITLPDNQEYAIGAVTAGGEAWYDTAVVGRLGVEEPQLDVQEQQARDRAREKEAAFRDGRPAPEFEDKRVVIVDDGIATGATMRACVRALVEAGASRVIVAVPVASPSSVQELHLEADEVVALQTPESFRAVGQFYRDFGQVSTAEAVEYLEQTSTAE